MNALTGFFRVGPAQNDHLPALRMALGVAVPLVTLLLIDRIDLAVFAVFGAFTGIHGRGDSHGIRLQHQVAAGCVLLAAIAAGLLVNRYDAGPWGVVAGSVVMGALTSYAADRLMLRPPGAFFHVFAFAGTASIPSTAPVAEALLAALVSVLLSIAIGAAGWLNPRWRSPWPGRRRLVPPSGQVMAGNAGRYAIAAGASGAIATSLNLGHNYWAILSAIVPLAAATRMGRLHRAGHRLLGTIGGVGITAVLLVPDLAPWQLVLVLIVLQFATEMFVIRHYALAMLFITPLALLMSELAAPAADTGMLLLDRLVETLIGVVVGVAVSLLVGDPRRSRA
ncbi:FUSC family protein [Arthrobacter sp. JZ12]|uniref:FUSC family protein n=1 Tax=Arthrobacter sp. JZ12 TaxID=2654190 RepID=UPI002B495465|nr:FUSC family protein [Arthrobacter sp. JZ12]